MARTRYLEVPNTPSVEGAAPQFARYQIPDMRLKANIEGMKGEFKAVDYSKNIADLQQPLVPQETINAMNRGAANSLQMASAVGQSFAQIGGAFAELGTALQKSKDVGDESRAKSLMEGGYQAFLEKTVGMSPIEQSKVWETEFAPQIQQGIGSLQMSPRVADEIAPAWQTYSSKVRTKLTADARDEQIKNDTLAVDNEIDTAINTGDPERAIDANNRLLDAGLQNQAQHQKRAMRIEEGLLEHSIQKDLNANPRTVQAEMEEIESTGKSDIYPGLKNPAIVAQYKNAARNEVNRREVDKDQEISDGILAGSIKTPEQIREAAAGNLSETRIAARIKMLETDPVYNAEAVTKLDTRIANYPQESDRQSLKEYHAIREEISTSAPKDLQGILNARLYQSATEAREGKFKTPTQKYQGELMSYIDHLGNIGMFDPPGFNREEMKKDPRYAYEHRDTMTDIWQKEATAKERMREWLNANPDATPEQAAKQLSETIGRDLTDAASRAAQPRKPTGSNMAPSYSFPLGPAEELQKRLFSRPPLTPEAIRSAVPQSYEFGGGVSSTGGHTVREVTSYRPGGTRSMGLSPTIEGGPLDAHGNMILGKSTMEDYFEGRGNYVTVAMDKSSDWQGKYLASAAYPGVVFKVMDNGGYGNNRTGRNWIDIAWTDPEQAKRFKQRNIKFEVVDAQEAKRIRESRA